MPRPTFFWRAHLVARRPLHVCGVSVLLLLLSCSPAIGQPAGAALMRRIAAAKSGETINVKPGNYGPITLSNLRFAKPVRLLAGGANFSGIVLRDIAGIEWIGGTVTGPGGRSYGINIASSRNVRIESMTITGAHRGIVIDRSANVAIVGNRLTGLISDGIDIALSHGVRVERNSCRNFSPTPAVYDAAGKNIKDGDHPDCIQAWSRPTAPPTSDLTIIGNDIEGRMQGIFLGNHVRNGVDDGGFDRVVIRGNRMKIAVGNGIAVGGGRNVLVTDNDVGTIPGSMLPNRPIPIKASIRINGEGAVACGNRVEAVPQGVGTQPCR